ncbi:ferredoxin-NADP reductase [Dongia mobilis]|uniref:Ferredoxin-NADP reductase n=2 Tax=Dongia mobilis TaxID=578943 RepID=A0A4R6WTI8_9PROT|nr:ferredoxin-NADP reductase [Dongia mobilis]
MPRNPIIGTEKMEQAGFYPLTVRSVVPETADAASLVFDTPADDVFDYRAGQYLTLRLQIAGRPVLRCYSMSSAPVAGEPLAITVKRVAGGVVSNWLIDHVRPGDRILARPPSGTFVLAPEPRPLLLFAGGSGITPVFAILRQALAGDGPAIRFFYASQSPEAEIFRTALDRVQAAHADRLTLHRHYDSRDGHPDMARLADFAVGTGDAIAESAIAYVCGPAPFMNNVEAALAQVGLDPARIHSERFVMPAPEAVPALGDAASLTIAIDCGVGIRQISCRADQTILAAALDQRLPVPWSCGQGICGACIAELTAGSVAMPQSDLLTAEERKDGLILLCQARPRGPDCRVRLV